MTSAWAAEAPSAELLLYLAEFADEDGQPVDPVEDADALPEPGNDPAPEAPSTDDDHETAIEASEPAVPR